MAHVKQHSVGIAMSDAGYRTVMLLPQGVLNTVAVELLRVGNGLLPDGVSRFLDQAQVVRIDA